MAKEREGILSLCAVVLRQRVIRGAFLMCRQWSYFFALTVVALGFVLGAYRSAWADEKIPPAAKGEKAKYIAGREAIRKALETPVKIEEAGGVELAHFLADVEWQIRVRILVSTASLKDAAIDQDTKVSLNVVDMPAGEVLDHVLGDLKLATVVRDNHLLVTTREVADQMMEVQVYDVTDLLMLQDASSNWYQESPDRLVDLLTSTIAPTTWDTIGGRGSIKAIGLPLCTVFVCSQSQDAHSDIEKLLAQLRKHEAQHRGTAAIPSPTIQDMLRRQAFDRETHGTNMPDLAGTVAVLLPSPHRDTLVRQTNRFAWELYRQLSTNSDGNVFFSPTGAALCLGVLRTGAKQRTGEELDALLHFRVKSNDRAEWALPEDQITPAFASLLESMQAQEATHGYELRVASSFLPPAGQNCLPAFEEVAKQLGVEFLTSDKPDPATRKKVIDAWTAAATRGKRTDDLPLSSVADAPGGVLRNVVSFHGQWLEPFEADKTKPADFRAGAKRWRVPMMFHRESLRYLQADSVQIVEKPYQGGAISMIILLPRDEPAALTELEKRLDAATVEDWLPRMRSVAVQLYLPRFQFRQSYQLKKPLSDLGMPTAFDAEKANFDGIIASRPQLYIEWFDQDALVEVDEQGTRAEAVTTAGFGMGGPMSGPMPIIFRADHPFLFLLRDVRTGAILFIGRYAVPTEMAEGK